MIVLGSLRPLSTFPLGLQGNHLSNQGKMYLGFQQSHAKVTTAMLLEETLQNLNLISLRFIFYISYFIVKMHVNTSIPLKLAVEELARLDLERIKDGPGIYPGIHMSMHSFIHSMRHCDLQSSLFLVMVALEWLIFLTWLRNEELWDNTI